MWKSSKPVELDFFAMEASNSSPRSTTVNGIQKAMSRIDPPLLKAIFTKDTRLDEQSSTEPTTTPVPSPENSIEMKEKGMLCSNPMTIFYNGDVSVFNVAPDKAVMIFKRAQDIDVINIESETNTPRLFTTCSSTEYQADQEAASSDQRDNFGLPVARRNSLKRFLGKRREG